MTLSIEERVAKLEVKVNIAAFLSGASFIILLTELLTRFPR